MHYTVDDIDYKHDQILSLRNVTISLLSFYHQTIPILSLNKKYTLWFSDELGSLMKLSCINDFDELLRVYSVFNLPSVLKVGEKHAIFKQAVAPVWSHVMNIYGGQWIVTVDEEEDNVWWTRMIYILLDEKFPLARELCGVFLEAIEPHKTRISMWTTNAFHIINNCEIADLLKKLGFPGRIDFVVHQTIYVKSKCPIKNFFMK